MTALTKQPTRFHLPPLGSFGWILSAITIILIVATILFNQLTPTSTPNKVPFPKANGSVTIPQGETQRIKAAWYTFGSIEKKCSFDIFSEWKDERFRWENWKSNNDAHGTVLPGECTQKNVTEGIENIMKYICGDTLYCQEVTRLLKEQLAERFLPPG
ncbi:hypothetical protein HY947_06855 [Candidatus Gottesmanbacteria bacterium]|nr:hypothetical protein [Candidatus Gottesmanbacteria bacterium]